MSSSPHKTSCSSSSYKKYEVRMRNPNPIIDNINTTISHCRRASIPIIFTRQCHKSPSDHSMLKEWFGDLIIDGTQEAELLAALDRKGEDMVVEKSTYSAFRKTGLEEKLVEICVEEVIVTRVMTNLCCETTARDAFIRGFRVFFSTDATATSDLDLHDATLKNMAYGFAYLVDSHMLDQALTCAPK